MAHHPGRNAVSQSRSAWPLRPRTFSGTPGGPWLAAYLRNLWTEFEQSVLDERGFAQVGFGVLLSSFHRLTLSSGGILGPEPLRLTHPSGVANALADWPPRVRYATRG